MNIDLEKRNRLVEKYNLMNFHADTIPKFVTIDDFFIGNKDEGSIAPNFTNKPNVQEYYETLKQLEKKNSRILVQICDINIYENGKLDDNEWPFTEYIYFVTNLTTDEIVQDTKDLFPDEVNYETDNNILKIIKPKPDENVIYIWWD